MSDAACVQALPLPSERLLLEGKTAIQLVWSYERSGPLAEIYVKAKEQQWDADKDIDWQVDLDPDNPLELPDAQIGIYGSSLWRRMSDQNRAELRRHLQAWQMSQFLHGEQGALICSAKIAMQESTLAGKLVAASQTLDEARHVEAYTRLVTEKFRLMYPATDSLQRLLGDVVLDSRWDITYLGMQVLVEGLALACFHSLQEQTKSSLFRQINRLIMRDEARHFAFGRAMLRDVYPTLGGAELRQREDFVIEAARVMKDHFLAAEIWHALGMPKQQYMEVVNRSPAVSYFRHFLFGRLIPAIRDLGLWSPHVQDAFRKMDLLRYEGEPSLAQHALQALDAEPAANAFERG
jgi:hypothetical protein